MDGAHDLGGMHGFGPVDRGNDAPVFEAPWEGRVHGMMLGLAVSGNLPGGFRYAIERMEPAEYLTTSYYEHWLHAVETLLREHGILDGGPPGSAAGGESVRALFTPSLRERPVGEPRFGPGDEVTVRRWSTPGHTRCPRYVRGVRGRIESVHPASRVADDESRIEPLYTVGFAASALWGDDADPTFDVRVDLWESYLEEIA